MVTKKEILEGRINKCETPAQYCTRLYTHFDCMNYCPFYDRKLHYDAIRRSHPCRENLVKELNEYENIKKNLEQW